MKKFEKIILVKLDKLGHSFKRTGKDYILTQCLSPKHNDTKPSMWINLNTGKGECFACNYKVGKKFWLNDLENSELYEELQREAQYLDLERQLQKQKTQKQNFVLPPKDKEVPEGWRGLNKQTIDKYGLYICQTGRYRNRVIFPFYDYNNNLVGYNTRKFVDINDGLPKYLYSKGIDIKSLIYPLVEKKTNELVIVEGIMDALSLVQVGIPAIANFGIGIHFTQNKINKLLKRGVNKLWLMFDNDKAGRDATYNFKKSFLNEYFEIDYAFKNSKLKDFYKSGCKDFNEYLQKQKRSEVPILGTFREILHADKMYVRD